MALQDAPRFSVPMPFNTLLWRVVVMTPDGYLEGERSVVADRGPGIPAARQRELFKPFTRLQVDPGDTISSGLGLSLAKQIVESAGGQLWYEARTRGGSRFVIELPEVAA